MFACKRLLANVILVDAASVTDSSAVGLAREFGGKTYKLPGAREGEFRFPRAPSEFSAIADAVASDPIASDDFKTAAVLTLLRDPFAIYPLGEDAGSGRHRVVLAGAFESSASGERCVLLASLSVTPRPTKWTQPTNLRFDVDVVGADADSLCDVLEDIRQKTSPAAVARLREGAPLAVWVGGSTDEIPDDSTDWIGKIERMGDVCGVRFVVAQQPARRVGQVRSLLHDRRPVVVVLWEPFAGSAEAISRFEDAAKAAAIVRIAEASLPDALLEARWELNALSLESGEVSGRGEEPPYAALVAGISELKVLVAGGNEKQLRQAEQLKLRLQTQLGLETITVVWVPGHQKDTGATRSIVVGEAEKADIVVLVGSQGWGTDELKMTREALKTKGLRFVESRSVNVSGIIEAVIASLRNPPA